MRHWHVVINTPGYLPESDPITVDTADHAKRVVRDLARETYNELSGGDDRVTRVEVEWADDLMTVWMEPTTIHSLGRVIEAMECRLSGCPREG